MISKYEQEKVGFFSLGVVVGRRRQPLGWVLLVLGRPAGTSVSKGGHPIGRRVFFSLTIGLLSSPRRWLQLRETKTSDAASVSE
jgi:hypothetical protein